jgi:hypothetical protein
MQDMGRFKIGGMKMEQEEKKDIVKVEKVELSPKEIAAFATDAARILKEIVVTSKTSVKISGNEYLKFEAWQTIAKFYNSTVTVEWTKPIMYTDESGKEIIFGWEARANVIDKVGRIIGSAESSCSREEDKWKTKANFQIKSMAQTRACAKAFRNVYSWIVVLSGYQPTPAEEMDSKDDNEEKVMTKQEAEEFKKKNSIKNSVELKCSVCGEVLPKKVYDWSMSHFNKQLCYKHQSEMRKQLDKAKPSDAAFEEEIGYTD